MKILLKSFLKHDKICTYFYMKESTTTNEQDETNSTSRMIGTTTSRPYNTSTPPSKGDKTN